MKKIIMFLLLISLTQSMFTMNNEMRDIINKKIEQVIGNDLLMCITKQPTIPLLEENLRILQEGNEILKTFSPTDANILQLQTTVNGLEKRNKHLLNLMRLHTTWNGNTPVL